MEFKNYLEQIEHLTINRVLFNNIVEIDDFREDFYDSVEMEILPHLNEEDQEDFFEREIFQYYIVSISGPYTQEHVNAGIIYIDSLDIYVLCVQHCGTAWDYVRPVNFIK